MKYFAAAPQANLAVLYVVARVLNARGPLKYDEMRALLRPEGLVTGQDDALQASLTVGTDLELLRVEGSDLETWHLGAALADQGGQVLNSSDQFRFVAATALMARARSQQEQGDDIVDLALGLAWILCSDPVRPFSFVADQDLWKRLEDARLRDVIAGDTQWGALRRWAVDLGFCVRIPSRGRKGTAEKLVADPTSLIRQWLEQVPPGAYGAREQLERLSETFPVLDSGAVAAALGERGVRLVRGDTNAGPVTYKALDRLVTEGQIALRERDDAPDQDRVTFMTWPGDTRRIDLVEVLPRG